MRPIQVKQLDYDLTPTAGLALVGHLLRTLAPVFTDLDAVLPVRTGVATSDIVRSYLGLLVQGKSDFDAIENVRGDKFFKQALGIGLLPSSPTLRQRMDAGAPGLAALGLAMIERLLAHGAADYGLLPCGWLPLDIDTFAMDNSGTAKEGVGRTYVGVDGYCPLAAYLGSHGFCLDLALRPGTQHSVKHTDDDLRRIVPLAQRLSAAGPKAPLLARLDSGFDSAALMASIESLNAPGLAQVDWLIKWNPRSTDAAQTAEERDAAGAAWEHPRVGKRVATWEQAGDEHPAADGSAWVARAGCTGAPRGQATPPQDGDAGADLPGGPLDRAWPADGARTRGQRPGGGRVHAAARAVRRDGIAWTAGLDGTASSIQCVPWKTASETGQSRPQCARIAVLRGHSRAVRSRQRCNAWIARPIRAHYPAIRCPYSRQLHPVSACVD